MFRWLATLSLLCGLLLSGLSGCKDNARACRQAAKKYISCMRKSHKHALQEKNAAKSKELLKKMGLRLRSKEWETRYLRLCKERPPTLRQLRCVRNSPCSKLSRCLKPSP